MTKQSFEKQLKSNKIRDPHRPIVHRSVFIIPNIIFLLVPGSFILPLDIIDTFHREDVYFSVGKKSWRTKAGNEEGWWNEKQKKKKKKKAACIHRYGFNEIAKGYDIRAKFLPEKRCPKRYETGRVLIVTGPFVVHFRSSHCSCYSEEPATRATSNPSDVPATRKLEIQCVFPPLVSCSSPFLYIYIYIPPPPIFSFRVVEHEMVVDLLFPTFVRRILPIFLGSEWSKGIYRGTGKVFRRG